MELITVSIAHALPHPGDRLALSPDDTALTDRAALPTTNSNCPGADPIA
jgi:hypothetical protein